MGGLWQALAYGFAGLRPEGSVLAIDPQLPAAWDALALRLRFRGSLVRLRLEHEQVIVESDRALPASVGGLPPVYGTRTIWTPDEDHWKVMSS